jgi:hypothetical protein
VLTRRCLRPRASACGEPPYSARLTPSGELHYTTVMTLAPSATVVDGVEFAVDTATSLLRTRSDRPLTGTGRVTELGLRFAGPLLLGLALLSLRGRVKR